MPSGANPRMERNMAKKKGSKKSAKAGSKALAK